MRIVLFILTSCIIFSACGKRNETPKGLLSEEKMQVVLWDMMRADQFLNDYVLNRDTAINKRVESIKLYKQIFEVHKISREDFQQSFQYYLQEPARFKNILDSVGTLKTPALQLAKQDSTSLDSIKAKQLD